ncbi:MAG TPA: glycine zipper 2TM domain-containing protein [Dissulfurispiraceae bacterium]|nr:glycine zipper 2TM domain-containing protein [Dissulfurispiraceae bacterium]
MKKIILCICFLFVSLQFGCTPAQVQGGGVGAGVGGIAGALLDHKNPWRGGLIGAALGGVFGATLGDISDRASYEAAQANRAARYRTEDGRVVYQADPDGVDEGTRCRKIRERVWDDDRLIKDRVREVCESERSDGYYREYREARPREYYYEPAPYYPPPPPPYYYYPYYGPSFYFFYGSGRHHRW